MGTHRDCKLEDQVCRKQDCKTLGYADWEKSRVKWSEQHEGGG